MATKKRNILMTIALPYANGAIHLGHMVEAIQADIWARFQKLQGHHCIFISGSDAHGTPVMLSAKKAGITPEELTKKMLAEHSQDFADFLIDFDNFYTTHSPENQTLTEQIYLRLKERGDIEKRNISHAFDPQAHIFLADRYIRGECPHCHTKSQYGDHCESCGSTYNPMELKNPTSMLSGATPVERESEHYFFLLEHYTDLLSNWISNDHLQPQITHKLQEWFDQGLKPWDISRDAPYFGFEIPDTPGKYFYVWLEAPVGYMASLKNLCSKNPDIDFDNYWRKDTDTELYHFIGKDIVYFHALFWPAILHSAGYRLPSAIFVHGFLTIGGHKMSKSRGTFITARHYLDLLDPEYLRYYFAAKLTAQIEDIDLNLQDFINRVNADLVGKFVNLASRCAGFISKQFDGQLAQTLPEADLYQQFIDAGKSIADHYEKLDYNHVAREIMALADRANQYIDHHKPWTLAKTPGHEQEVQAICTQGLNLFRVLATYLSPILPNTATKVSEFLNIPELSWAELKQPLLNHRINRFKPLMQRLTPEVVNQLTAQS